MEEDGKMITAGKAHIFTDKTFVFNRVKHGFSLILINALIKTVALWIIFLTTTNFFVSRPLGRISDVMEKVDPAKPTTKVLENENLLSLVKRSDELGLLSRIFKSMLNAIVENMDTIRSLNANLEKKVEQRTQALAEKTNDIQNMLQNMKQGIFTLQPDLKIHPEYSKHLEDILETDQIKEQNGLDLLFRDSNVSTNDLDQVRHSMGAIFGENPIAMELNEHLLIKEYVKIFQGKEKILKIDWEAIANAANQVDKIMIIVRDVTLERELEKEAKEQQEKINIISEILKISTDKFTNFYNNSITTLSNAKDMVEQQVEEEREMNIKLFRILHTLKGEARTYHFSMITNAVHESEQYHSHVLKKEAPWEVQIAVKNIGAIEDKLNNYFDVYSETLKTSNQSTPGLNTEIEECFNIARELQGLPSFEKESDVGRVKQLVDALVEIGSFSMSEIIGEQIDSLKGIADKSHKSFPDFLINDQGVRFPLEMRKTIGEIVLHLLRNSIDHGIEDNDTRKKKNKDATPQISFKINKTHNQYEIEYQDDGKGLDLSKIATKAKESGVSPTSLNTDIDIANLIFVQGISSQSKVTEISGRGVGMYIVRDAIREQGGEIDIQFTGEKNAGTKPFKFVIKIPTAQARKKFAA